MTGTSAPLRTLILTLNLLNSDLGLTAAELLERVPGYLPADHDSAMRKFERDVAALRATGLNVVVDSKFLARDEQPRYRVPRRHGAAGEIRLTKEEFAVLTKATNAWDTSTSTRALVILNKLRGKSDAEAQASASATHLGLDGGFYLPVIHEAIAKQQPVSFEYQSRSGKETRDVAPWNLVARGKALYLWGFDLNRWAPRLFRLSRFRSAPKLVAEPGSVAAIGELSDEEFSSAFLVVAPVLALKEGGAPLLRLRCSEIGEASIGDGVPSGWQILQGIEGDTAAWEAAIIREAADAVVLSPRWLRDSLKSRLHEAAAWAGAENV